MKELKTQKDCLVALVCGCVLQESVKGYTVWLYKGVQIKSNPRRKWQDKDYRFNQPDTWRIKHITWKYRILRHFI